MAYIKMNDSKYETNLRSKYRHFWKPHLQVEMGCEDFAVCRDSTPFIYSCFAWLSARKNLSARAFLLLLSLQNCFFNKLCETHVVRLCTTPKQIKTTTHNFASTVLLKTEE